MQVLIALSFPLPPLVLFQAWLPLAFSFSLIWSKSYYFVFSFSRISSRSVPRSLFPSYSNFLGFNSLCRSPWNFSNINSLSVSLPNEFLQGPVLWTSLVPQTFPNSISLSLSSFISAFLAFLFFSIFSTPNPPFSLYLIEFTTSQWQEGFWNLLKSYLTPTFQISTFLLSSPEFS